MRLEATPPVDKLAISSRRPLETMSIVRPNIEAHVRVGVLSPNIVLNVDDWNSMYEEPTCPWRFDSVAKKAALLFDKLYVTHDLDVTCQLIESGNGDSDSNPYSATLRYLSEHGFILQPTDLGYTSTDHFLNSNIVGTVATLNTELVRIGNFTGIDDDEDYLIGQPDVGDWAAHDGWHPRLPFRSRRSMSIGEQRKMIDDQKWMYESLLLRRNVALLRQAGLPSVAIAGRLYQERHDTELSSPVWRVIFEEMPQLDTRASWQDVFDFRKEEKTQHLIRNVRRWARKIVAEDWTAAELQDEVRELLYEYENHLRIARMGANKGILEILITGTADLAENIVKLRLGKIGALVSLFRERKVKLLEEESKAPGRELALLAELRKSSVL
jgi:hypothetical protein